MGAGGPDGEPRLGKIAERTLMRWAVETDRRVRVSRLLAGGGTEAVVAVVLLEEPGRPARKLILKVCPPRGEMTEPGRHRRALREAPEGFAREHLVGQPFDPVPLEDGGWLLFQEVAQGNLERFRPMAELMDGAPDRLGEACAAVVRALLTEWNTETRFAPVPVPEFVRMHLDPRVDLDGVDGSARALALPGGAASPDPVALARDGRLSAGLTVNAVVGKVHGDLNLGNVLIPYEHGPYGPAPRAGGFRLIDLSRYSPEAPLSRDPQHLVLWVVSRRLRVLSVPQRNALLGYLSGDDPAAGARLPVWLRDVVVEVAKVTDAWAAGCGFGDDWAAQRRLSLLAGALRRVTHPRLSLEDRRWFLELAARAGGVYLRSAGREVPVTDGAASVRAERELVDPPAASAAVDRRRGLSPAGGPAARPAYPRQPTAPRNPLFRLVDALLDTDTMARDGSRDQVVSLLSRDVAGAIPRLPSSRADVISIVRTCLRYPKGLEELLSVVGDHERDSLAMRRLAALADELLAAGE